VIREFEPLRRHDRARETAARSTRAFRHPVLPGVPTDVIEGEPFPEPADAVAQTPLKTRATGGTLTEVLSPDPLLTRSSIGSCSPSRWWSGTVAGAGRSRARAGRAPPRAWEIAAYRSLVDERVGVGTTEWELEAFFLRSAALRIKMDGERSRVRNLAPTESADRVFEILERSGQSLERAREMDHRFQWFIDDLLYSGGHHPPRAALPVPLPVPARLLRPLARTPGARRLDSAVGSAYRPSHGEALETTPSRPSPICRRHGRGDSRRRDPRLARDSRRHAAAVLAVRRGRLPVARTVDWAALPGILEDVSRLLGDPTWIGRVSGVLGMWIALWCATSWSAGACSGRRRKVALRPARHRPPGRFPIVRVAR